MTPVHESQVRRSRRVAAATIMAMLLGAAMVTPVAARDDACAPDAEKAATEAVARWQAGLVRAEPGELAGLYAGDGLVVDRMMDNSEHRGQRAIIAFYGVFLRRHPAADTKITGIVPGCNRVEATGTLLLRIAGPRKGTRNLLDGRFDIRLEHKDGRWQLARHELQLAKKPNRAVVDSAPKGAR